MKRFLHLTQTQNQLGTNALVCEQPIDREGFYWFLKG